MLCTNKQISIKADSTRQFFPVGPLPVAVPLGPVIVAAAAAVLAPVAAPVGLLPLPEGRAGVREKVRLHLVPEPVLSS